MRKQLRLILVVMISVVFILSGCSTNESQQEKDQTKGTEDNQKQAEVNKTPVAGGKLRYGVLSLPDWNPLKWEEATPQSSPAEQLVYRGLFTYTPKQELIGDLVKDYSSETTADGNTVLHITLKENLRWHDGTPISFEDVQFTLKTYLNPFYYGAWKQNLTYINGTSLFRSGKKENISGISQNEKGEILLSLDHPSSSFLHALTAPILPAHQLQGKTPEEINRLMMEGKVIGNGPFKFGAKSEQEIRLSRGFTKEEGGPYLDELSFLLYNGEVQSFDSKNEYEVLAVPPHSDTYLSKSYQSSDITRNLFYYLGFNDQDQIMSKPEVRKAIIQGIDRKAIIDQLLYGHGEELGTILPADAWANDSSLQIPQVDVEGAKKAIEALGYTAEKPLSLKIHYQGDLPIVEKLINLLSEQLKKIDVAVIKQPLNGEQYYAYLFSGKSTQAFIHAWPFSKDAGQWWKLFGSYHDVKDLGLNILHYHNTEADKLLQQLYTNLPDATQKEKVIAFLKIMNQDLALLPLFAPKQTYWIADGVHGVGFNGDSWLLDVANWWIEK